MLPRNIRMVVRLAALLPVVCAARPSIGAHAQDASPPDALPSVAVWQPEYTSYLLLSDTDDLVELATGGDTLWLSTERVVSRFRRGVWTQPELVADDAMVLALAPLGDGGEALAFGYEGGAWLRRAGSWSALDSHTRADLYDAYAWSDYDAWAVGFEYESEYGVLVHYDGFELHAYSWPWLLQRQLLAVAGSPGGELWAGGCDGNDLPFLMRDGGTGHWEPAEAPAVAGCIEDISFAPDGSGLAAADGDLLWWDGYSWQAFGRPPPEGLSWVRVAHGSGVGSSSPSLGAPPGWAIPGVPTWRGYIDAGSPWYFDGDFWSELPVDYRGYDGWFKPSEMAPGAQPFLDMVSWEGGPVSVSRSVFRSELPGQRRAGLMQLTGREARLEHPLIFALYWPTLGSPAPAGGGDIAALEGGGATVGARVGAAPLIARGWNDDAWQPALGAPAARGRDFWISLVDLATPWTGWALGGTIGSGASEPVAWRWDGETWRDAPSPIAVPDRQFVQLRALPDGTAWALTSNARLNVFADGAWSTLPDDTPAVGPVWAPDGQLQLLPLRAPFDVVEGPEGSAVGWVATRQQLYLYVDGEFRAMQPLPRGQVVDLQLTDPGRGWAIGYDRNAAGSARSRGILMRLEDRRWSEVDLTEGMGRAILELARRGQGEGDLDLATLQWWLMSAMDESEVWLVGSASRTDRSATVPLLVRFRADERGGPPRDVLVFRDCNVDALSAVPAPGGGTDVWLMGRSQCGPAVTGVSRRYAGPVSLLRVRDTLGTVYLPITAVRATRTSPLLPNYP